MNEQLYRLLPLTYRERDFDHRQSFRALMAVLQTGQDKLDENMMLLYQNWFIETCENERIPYIADLVNVRDLDSESVFAIQRRYVANYLAYQRRSGSVTTFNNSVHDTTGYACYSINSTEKMLTSWTERDPQLVTKTFSVKDNIEAPFSQGACLPKLTWKDTALIAAKRGVLSPQVLQVYLWRRQAVSLVHSQLFAAPHIDNGWTLGRHDEVWPLCHQPKRLGSLDTTQTAQEYPYAIVHNNYDDGVKACVTFFEWDPSINQMTQLADSDIVITDLSAWQKNDGKNARLLFDPALGRVLLLDEKLNGRLLVSYHYLHNGFFGASPRYRGANAKITPLKRLLALYPKEGQLSEALVTKPIVTPNEAPSSKGAKSLQVAFAINAHYGLTQSLKIDLKGENVTLVAEDYVCPTLSGTIEVSNTGDTPAQLILNGMRVYGQICIDNNVDIQLKDSSLLADILWLSLPSKQEGDRRLAQIKVENGLIVTHKLMKHAHYQLNNSAVICASPSTVRAFRCHNSTVIGDITCYRLDVVCNSVIDGTFSLINPNRVKLAYSYFRVLVLPHGAQTEQVVTDAMIGRHGVQFASTRYFDAAFLVLTYGTDQSVLTGADNGEEMGVFNQQFIRRKEQNIKNQFDRFLPLGMEVQTDYMD
ncbi:phage tail protein [uncultured Shewanella sp.]|uniref:phage tail protein n=1 Tax=uncultured Shewanella sp. TaxID=173975 RepID=UPI0026382B31|nr:phage tail protein [uncultured Shewanella sp.]